MWDLKVCRVCLASDVKVFHMQKHNLVSAYEALSGIKVVPGDGMPLNLCLDCAVQLRKLTSFRKKCRRAHFALKQIADVEGEIKLNRVKAINRVQMNLTSTLAPCAVGRQHVTNISNQDRCYINYMEPEPSAAVFNVTAVVLDKVSRPSRAGKRRRKKDSPAVIEAAAASKRLSSYFSSFGGEESYSDFRDSDDQIQDKTKGLSEDGAPTPSRSQQNGQVETGAVSSSAEKGVTEPGAAKMEIEKEWKYECKMCPLVLPTRNQLYNHQRRHSEVSGKNECDVCHVRYRSLVALATHIARQHP